MFLNDQMNEWIKELKMLFYQYSLVKEVKKESL